MAALEQRTADFAGWEEDAPYRAETLLRSNVQPALVLEGLAADLPAGG